MNQTWVNGKKPSFGPNFGHFSPNLGPKIFFVKFYLYNSLDIVASYHYVNSRKTNKLYLRKWQKSLENKPDFGLLGPNLGHQSFFQKSCFVSQ